MPGARVHLYGKRPRKGRKMGHLVAVGDTADQAVAAVREAHRRLLGGVDEEAELSAAAGRGSDPEDQE